MLMLFFEIEAVPVENKPVVLCGNRNKCFYASINVIHIVQTVIL